MPNYTRGPWKWNYDPKSDHVGELLGAGGKQVLNLGSYDRYESSCGDPPSDEDERLIAAAPEMYEMLRNYCKHYDYIQEHARPEEYTLWVATMDLLKKIDGDDADE